MNLATYTALVQTEVDDTSTRAKNVIEQAVKDTYQEILNYTVESLVGTSEEDVTATASQRYIETVNTYQDLKNVLYKSSAGTVYNYLTRISEQDYYKMNVNRDDSTPLHYYLNADKIYFDVSPVDAGTVKVNGVVVQDELTGSTVSVIPDRFTQVVVKGSVAHFKSYEGVQDAREYFKIYRGPYYEQGKIGGSLKWMMEQTNTKEKPLTMKLR